MDLYNAAIIGNIRECKRLLKYSRYKKVVNYGFVGACIGDHRKLIEYIQDRFSDNRNFDFLYGLFAAARCGNLNLFDKLFLKFNQVQESGIRKNILIILAILGGNFSIIDKVLHMLPQSETVIEVLALSKSNQTMCKILNHRELGTPGLLMIKFAHSSCEEAIKIVEKYDSINDLEIFGKYAGFHGSPTLIDYLHSRGVRNYQTCFENAIISKNFKLVNHFINNSKFTLKLPNLTPILKHVLNCIFDIPQIISAIAKLFEIHKVCWFKIDELRYIETCDALNFGLPQKFVLNYPIFKQKRENRILYVKSTLQQFIYNDIVYEICKFVEY